MLYQNVAVANDYCLKDLFEWITRRTVPDFQCFENKLGSATVPLQVFVRPVRHCTRTDTRHFPRGKTATDLSQASGSA